MTRGQSLFTFEFFPDDIVALTAERIFANGIRYHTPYDALNDMRNMEVPVRAGKKAGLYVDAGVVYTVSPVHTDAYYARKIKELVALGADAIFIKDPSGLLTPERAATLIPAAKDGLRRAATATAFALSHRSWRLTWRCRLSARCRCRSHRHLDARQWRVASRRPRQFIHNVGRHGYETGVDLELVERGRRKAALYCQARRQAASAISSSTMRFITSIRCPAA